MRWILIIFLIISLYIDEQRIKELEKRVKNLEQFLKKEKGE
jgi:hypothetical protein